jgi:hypothetical protein
MRTETRTSTATTTRYHSWSARQAAARGGPERPGRIIRGQWLPRERGEVAALADQGQASLRVRRDVAGLECDELRDELLGLTRRLTSGTYELLVLVGELDARGTFVRWGALSCAAWLASACDIEAGTAHNQVRVARAMRAFAALDAAMAAGDVSYAKARVLVPCLTEANVDELIGIAESTPASRLGAAIAAWSQRNDDPDVISRRQHEARSTSWRTEADGMIVVTHRFTPAVGGAYCAAIDAQVPATEAPAGASLAQQRADATAQIVTTCGGSGGSGRTVHAEVVVHVREDGNTLTDGTPLSDHAVTRMLPDAFISLLMHDAQRQPIDASPRRRFPTRRQARVIDERHHECAHPGCTARHFLQHDHIQPNHLGGPTILDNLQRLCGPHNRAKEQARRPGR